MERLVERAYVAFSEEARRRSIDYRQSVAAKPVIISDGDRVLQIITNLLSNAFRWTPDGGEIELELTATDGTVYVAVDDSGPGVPPVERERIFRPFWSRDGGGGTGLGLAIARELAAALGGRIQLETSSGEGSRFELVLPIQPK
jgi:signal transduction histidine kinase